MSKTTVPVVLFGIALAILSAFLPSRETNAYTLTGFRFNHLDITYSCGSPELAQAVQEWASVSGLRDGGCSSAPDITLTIVPDSEIPPPVQGYGGAGHIWIADRAQHHYGIMLHETGHAIGIGHSSESFSAPYIYRTAAMFAYCCNPLNEDDRAAVQALYGPSENVSPTPTSVPSSPAPTRTPRPTYRYFVGPLSRE